jgi:Predicted RNA-binding protein
MCEANVYIIDESGNEKLFLEAVDRIVPEDENLLLENIFGQRKTVKARIKEMQLVDHKIILQK